MQQKILSFLTSKLFIINAIVISALAIITVSLPVVISNAGSGDKNKTIDSPSNEVAVEYTEHDLILSDDRHSWTLSEKSNGIETKTWDQIYAEWLLDNSIIIFTDNKLEVRAAGIFYNSNQFIDKEEVEFDILYRGESVKLRAYNK